MKAGNLPSTGYNDIQSGIVALLEGARASAVRSVNTLMTATYWEIGRRIVAFEQGGADRAEYGEALVRRLAADLSHHIGRGAEKQGHRPVSGRLGGSRSTTPILIPPNSRELETRLAETASSSLPKNGSSEPMPVA
jgi:hypothetical protein